MDPATRAIVVLWTLALALVACAPGNGATSTDASPVPACTATDPVDPSMASTSTADPVPSRAPLPRPTQANAAPSVVTRISDQPAVEAADGESWTNPGAIIAADGRWWMLRNSFSGFPGSSRTDVLVSDDLVDWEPVDAAQPAYDSGDIPGANGNTFAMTGLVDDDGTWTAWYSTYGGSMQPGHIGRVTSPGPKGPWTPDEEPALAPGDEGAWDERRVADPEVVRHGDEWLLFYVGIDTDDNSAIGLATSPDGQSWTRHGDPVLVGRRAWTGGGVDDPQVIGDGRGGLVMFYDAPARGVNRTGMATSPDGRTWDEWSGNPMITVADTPDNTSFFQAALVPTDGNPVWLLESAPTRERTIVHAYEVDVDLARSTVVPTVEAEASVDGDRVIIDVDVDGMDLGVGDDRLHPHAWVDRAVPPPGTRLAPDDPGVVHGTDGRLVVEGLAAGDHDLWVLLAGDDDVVVEQPDGVLLQVTIE